MGGWRVGGGGGWGGGGAANNYMMESYVHSYKKVRMTQRTYINPELHIRKNQDISQNRSYNLSSKMSMSSSRRKCIDQRDFKLIYIILLFMCY